jgi:hypothetical protein
MERGDVEAKALELMSPVLGSTRAKSVVSACNAIDTMKNVGDLVRLIAT